MSYESSTFRFRINATLTLRILAKTGKDSPCIQKDVLLVNAGPEEPEHLMLALPLRRTENGHRLLDLHGPSYRIDPSKITLLQVQLSSHRGEEMCKYLHLISWQEPTKRVIHADRPLFPPALVTHERERL